MPAVKNVTRPASHGQPSMHTAHPDRLAAFVRDLCAQPSILCEHHAVTTLRNYGDPMGDHETADVQCRDCGDYLVATIWRTEDNRAVEFSPMPEAMQTMYARRQQTELAS